MTLTAPLPPVIRPGVLNLPGSTPESKELVETLLEKDRQQNHCFFRASGFHNHNSHHLLAAFDLGAPAKVLQAIYDEEQKFQRPIDLSGEQKDLIITQDNWKEFLGQHLYYASYLSFFSTEVAAHGAAKTLETYVLAQSVNENNVEMFSRFLAGAFHPIIQIGYGAEFGSDAMIAQALAQTAMHLPTELIFPTIDQTQQPSHKQSPTSRLTLFEILRQVYDSPILHPVMPYDPDALLTARLRAISSDGRPEEIMRISAQWWHPATDADPADLEKKAEELTWMATLLLAATGKPGRKPRLDFFLMHVLNTSLFLPSLMKIMPAHESKVRFLKGLLPVIIMYILSRGRPRIDPKLIMTYTATPRPPLDRATLPVPDSCALGDPRDDQCINPWPAILAGVVHAPDSHTVKAVRALYYGTQRYGLTRCGDVPGAFRDVEGRKVETHGGIGLVDGTVFVRAAGVVMDTLGWVSWGEKEGQWDRSGLGWDGAWEGN